MPTALKFIVGACSSAFLVASSVQAQNTVVGTGSGAGSGSRNLIWNSLYARIGGGFTNAVVSSAHFSTVGGGYSNFVNASTFATIGGGSFNLITSNATNGTIAGGQFNEVRASGGAVPGGFANEASGINSFAAGAQALATNAGTFVWGDMSTNTDFFSTGSNQFLIRAQGGVGVNTNNPGTNALLVNGSARITGNLVATTINGMTNFTGPQGPVGLQGPAGPQGAAGPQGEQGVPGPKGDKGDQGLAGATGESGPPGADGRTILSGAVGPTPAQGAVGDFYVDTTAMLIYGPKVAGGWGTGTPLVGPQGIKGDTGDQGPQGATGPAGPQGDQGPAGPVGDQGPPGLAGAEGPAGPQGEVGPQGPAGPTGATGPTGPQGEQGLPGPKGDKGDPPDLAVLDLRYAPLDRVRGLESRLNVLALDEYAYLSGPKPGTAGLFWESFTRGEGRNSSVSGSTAGSFFEGRLRATSSETYRNDQGASTSSLSPSIVTIQISNALVMHAHATFRWLITPGTQSARITFRYSDNTSSAVDFSNAVTANSTLLRAANPQRSKSVTRVDFGTTFSGTAGASMVVQNAAVSANASTSASMNMSGSLLSVPKKFSIDFRGTREDGDVIAFDVSDGATTVSNLVQGVIYDWTSSNLPTALTIRMSPSPTSTLAGGTGLSTVLFTPYAD